MAGVADPSGADECVAEQRVNRVAQIIARAWHQDLPGERALRKD
ncbi:hypothetical protein WDV93_17650 [Pantoea ananatis]